ncbi:hypothetical protein VNO78_23562 [Psophocarpus tetragonolobus]|uniref:Uncharacterized protein n=1 Tax=Psophocarpus tetragonolobus TaxID=3891 RepID=A0AAN9S3E4_PSOTE
MLEKFYNNRNHNNKEERVKITETKRSSSESEQENNEILEKKIDTRITERKNLETQQITAHSIGFSIQIISNLFNGICSTSDQLDFVVTDWCSG